MSRSDTYNTCGHCGKQTKGGWSGINCHMHDVHGDAAAYHTNGRWYGRAFLKALKFLEEPK